MAEDTGTEVTETLGNVTEFRYDDRVTTETWKQGGSTVRTLDFTYDTVDRLTALDDSDSRANDFEFTYDDEGNTLTRTEIASGEVTEYEWDHRNRLVRIVERTSASGSITQEIEYIYDAFDQRVGKRLDSDGNGTWDRDETHVWTAGQTHLRLTDSDGQGTTETFHVASRYLYGDIVDHLLADEQFTDGAGPAADATTASTTAGETLWALVDHLGSVRDLVANAGVIREHVVYDSFGNRLVEQDYDLSGNAISSSHAEAVDSLFGYTGRDWDKDAGLQYNRARWYDPATGRWLSQDPIGFEAGDANLYRYVGNQPTVRIDPTGLQGHRPRPPANPPVDRDRYGEGWYVVRKGDVGEAIREEYLGRAAGGCLIIPQLYRFQGMRMEDDGQLALTTAQTRAEFLVAFAIASGVPADGKFYKVTVPEWTNAYGFVERVPITGGSAGFWISTPHTLDASGTYEIRLTGGFAAGQSSYPTAEVRNVDLRWRLTDRIDANSIREFDWRGGGPDQILAGCLEVTLGDIVGDKVLGAGFDFQAFFDEVRPEKREVRGPAR